MELDVDTSQLLVHTVRSSSGHCRTLQCGFFQQLCIPLSNITIGTGWRLDSEHPRPPIVVHTSRDNLNGCLPQRLTSASPLFQNLSLAGGDGSTAVLRSCKLNQPIMVCVYRNKPWRP